MVLVVVLADFYHSRPVLVTGGTGFIGRRLVTVLQAQGAQVRVLVRPSSQIPSDWNKVECVSGDLADVACLARACMGIDTVIHAAGFAHADATNNPDFAARHWAVNAESVFRLIDTAIAAKVKRFVLLSSVKATAEPGSCCVDEQWDASPETPYGQAKRAAEQQVLAASRDQSLHGVNLRLALVYGPGMKGNLARLMSAVQRGPFPPLPETGNRRSLVHIDDVAQAALLAAAHPAAAGQSYLVTDGQPCSGRELYVIVRQALGLATPCWAVPAVALHAAAFLVDSALRWTGRESRAAVALDKLLGWACYDSTRICRELGYQPAWTFQQYCESGGLSEWHQ